MPKEEINGEKSMFPEMFNLSESELFQLKGGNVPPDCDALCYPSEWGGSGCPS